jgi:hypothetical protein
MMSQEEIEEFLYKYKSTNMIFVNDKDKMKYNRILLENIDLKNRLDKIKEYIKLERRVCLGLNNKFGVSICDKVNNLLEEIE